MGRHLKDRDRDSIVALYETRFEEYGHHHKTVGWGSDADQLLRFEVLCRGLDLHGKSILDVGCGLGDMVPFLEEKTGGDFAYTGIDIAPALVQSAHDRFGKQNIRFLCTEMSKLPADEEYDIVLLSGALSYRVEDNVKYAKSVMAELYDKSRETVAVNFLSSYVDYEAEKNFHYSPEEIFSYSKELTRWVTLYHDYPLWEFTVQLHHSPQN